MITSRRKLLAAMRTATVGGLSGCTGVTEQSFEASPVVIPEADQEELVMAETTRDSEAVTREGPGNVEVSITNHAFACQRGPARGAPTVLEKFASSVNQTPGAGNILVVAGSDVGIDEATLDFLGGGDLRYPANGRTIIPEGARDGDTIDPGVTMVFTPYPGWGRLEESVEYTGNGPGAFFPGDTYFPSDAYSSESPDEFRVFVPNIGAFMDKLPAGQEVSGLGAEQVEPGETIETADTVFAGTGDVMFPGDTYDEQQVPDIYDRGTMLPLGGQPFGVAALSTPAAEVAGQSANPLVDMGTEELLQQDAARRMLSRTGITDQDEMVEWLAGPEEVTEEKGYRVESESQMTLLGEETDEPQGDIFVGVVSGEDGPWGVLVNVARITDDDHVVAVSALSRPVGTEDGGMELMRSGQFMHGKLMEQALEFSVETMGRMSRVDVE
jgi:hypothetical protein